MRFNSGITLPSLYGLFPGSFEQKSYVHSLGPCGTRAAPYEFCFPYRARRMLTPGPWFNINLSFYRYRKSHCRLNRSEHFDELKCYCRCQLPVQSRTIWRFAENTDPNAIKSFGKKPQHNILVLSTMGRHSVYRCQQRDGILSTNNHAHWYISWPGTIYRYLTVSGSRIVLGPSRSWQSFQFNLDSMQVRCLSIWYRYAPVNRTPWYFSWAGTVCR